MIDQYAQKWIDVIENMKNSNTYKLAWGRAILETIQDKENNDGVVIDFDELSPKIIKYYWNQIYFFNLSQGTGKKPKIENIVNEMITKYQNDTSSKIPVWYEKANTLFAGTLYYNDTIKEVSNILTENVSWRFPRIGDTDNELYILDLRKKTISFDNDQVESLKDFAFPLSQLLNYRWAQLLELYNTAPRISSKVRGISDNKLRRNNLKKYRDILLNMFDGDPIDFYTGKVLEENDISVDHVIPWSFMYSDDIWNLVLTSKSSNSLKSNMIPSAGIISKLKARNEELLKHINDHTQAELLEEAIKNDYLDKYYNACRMGI